MTINSIFFLFVIVICLVLIGSYVFTGDFKFWEIITLGMKVGSLQIQGAFSNVTNVFMNYTVGGDGLPCSLNPGDCPLQGTQNLTKRITVKATINRSSGDCNSGLTVIAHLCNGTQVTCRPSAADLYNIPGISLTFLTGQQWGGPNNNFYCNYSGFYDLEYYRHNGWWTVNVSVAGGGYTNYTMKGWYMVEIPGYEYPFVPGIGTGGAIPLGTVSANQWNFGLGANVSKNTGNQRMIISFNASNFTDGSAWIDVHGSASSQGRFSVQNISGNPFGISQDYENMSYDPTTPGSGEFIPVPFYPDTGMKRCGNIACSQDEFGGTNPNNQANYTLWWSIYVPVTQVAVYYNNINTNASWRSD